MWDNFVDTTHTVNREYVPTVSVLCGVLCGTTMLTLPTQLTESPCPLSVFCVVFLSGTTMWTLPAQLTESPCLLSVLCVVFLCDSLFQTILQGTFDVGRRHGRQKKCWMDNIRDWTYLPMPELLITASCRKDRKRISAESTIMFPRRPNRSRTGLN